MASSEWRGAVIALVFLGGCMSVDGRIRPIWKPEWSEVTCAAAPAATLQSLDVEARLMDDSLPGMTITAHHVSGPAPRPWQYTREEVTDGDGKTVLRLPPGIWVIRGELGGFHPVEQRVVVDLENRCVVRFHTAFDQAMTIQ